MKDEVESFFKNIFEQITTVHSERYHQILYVIFDAKVLNDIIRIGLEQRLKEVHLHVKQTTGFGLINLGNRETDLM